MGGAADYGAACARMGMGADAMVMGENDVGQTDKHSLTVSYHKDNTGHPWMEVVTSVGTSTFSGHDMEVIGAAISAAMNERRAEPRGDVARELDEAKKRIAELEQLLQNKTA